MKEDKITCKIVEKGEEYQKKLRENGKSPYEIDRLLTEWIKDKLDYCKNHPEKNEEELLDYINGYDYARRK